MMGPFTCLILVALLCSSAMGSIRKNPWQHVDSHYLPEDFLQALEEARVLAPEIDDDGNPPDTGGTAGSFDMDEYHDPCVLCWHNGHEIVYTMSTCPSCTLPICTRCSTSQLVPPFYRTCGQLACLTSPTLFEQSATTVPTWAVGPSLQDIEASRSLGWPHSMDNSDSLVAMEDIWDATLRSIHNDVHSMPPTIPPPPTRRAPAENFDDGPLIDATQLDGGFSRQFPLLCVACILDPARDRSRSPRRSMPGSSDDDDAFMPGDVVTPCQHGSSGNV